jgi:multiple sugar transport system substrate-binding protein/alpha-glucoside transport system substrate-binding protein
VVSRKFAAVGAAVVALALAAACSSSSGGGDDTKSGSSDSGLPSLKGQAFTVLGQWTGGEATAFQAVLDQFNKETGAKGTYSPVSGGDMATVLGTQIAGGTPPDVAALALPGLIQQYAAQGKLQPVTADIESEVKANFSGEWATLGTAGGKLYGVPIDASNKSTVWYDTKAFTNAGIKDTPDTWDDLIADGNTLSDSGVSVPIAVGGGDGWTLTDWFENVYMRTAGLDMYDKLTHHQIPWTDPSVTTALTTLKQIWGNPKLIGSPADAVTVTYPASVDNTFKDSPTSAIVYEGSFVATQITGDKLPAVVGTDAKFFPFPSINGSPAVLESGGDFGVAFTTNPAAQPFLKYLASVEAGKTLVGAKGSGFLIANKNVPASAYSDSTSGQLGQQIVSVGDNFRFDMSDQAPAAFGGTANQGEWAILQTFLTNGDIAAAQSALEAAAAAQTWS